MDVSLILKRAIFQLGCCRFFIQQPKTPPNLWYFINKVFGGMLLECLGRLSCELRILTESMLSAGMLVATQHP